MMKPQIIVKVQDHEKFLEKLPLQTCGNNVCELTMKMSDWREQIFTKRGNKNAYDDNFFLTILFQALAQTTNPDFGLEVKLEKSRWAKGTNIDISDIIRGFNTSFKNFVADGI